VGVAGVAWWRRRPRRDDDVNVNVSVSVSAYDDVHVHVHVHVDDEPPSFRKPPSLNCSL
jgi:hypothetical protein